MNKYNAGKAAGTEEKKGLSGTRSGPGKIFSRKNLKRAGVLVLVLGLLGGGGYALTKGGLPQQLSGGKTVEFQQLEADNIPQTIEKDVIPEYRELERALGCIVDGKVYVIVTRGEKPTAEFDLAIEKMKLEKTENGKNLVVTARFIEPPEGKTVAQIITYPYKVALTELTELPDTIELRTVFE